MGKGSLNKSRGPSRSRGANQKHRLIRSGRKSSFGSGWGFTSVVSVHGFSITSLLYCCCWVNWFFKGFVEICGVFWISGLKKR